MHTERVSRCNVRRPRSILERFLLVPEPLRSFPLIKNNDCSFEMRSHSWRRRNGIGTGIIIISLLSTFFFFSSPENLVATRTQVVVHGSPADVQGRTCHLRYLCTIGSWSVRKGTMKANVGTARIHVYVEATERN